MEPITPAKSPRKSNTTLIIVLIVIGILVLGSVGGCLACRFCASKAVKEGVEQATGLEVDEEGGKISVKGEGGEFEAQQGELPEGFSDLIPIYDGASVESGSSVTNDEGKIYSVSLKTSDSYDKVVNFYKSELPKDGWTPENTSETSVNGEKATTFTFSEAKSKGSGWITVTQTSDGITIGYYINPKS
jgi:hypothetical protein